MILVIIFVIASYAKKNMILRKAHRMYPNNNIFQNCIHVKYNRAKIGNLKINEIAPIYILDKLTRDTNFIVFGSIT